MRAGHSARRDSSAPTHSAQSSQLGLAAREAQRFAAARHRVASFWHSEGTASNLQLCLNRCPNARNGVCEDRDGKCREGMDCSDCGVRSYKQPPVGATHQRRRAAWRKWVVPASLADVCLCTLMTADRVPSLHRLASAWGHLLSVAYLADDFTADSGAGFQLLRHRGQPVPYESLLTLSVVEDRKYRFPRSRFPYNMLRNIAISASPVDFVCLVDVDFVLHPQPHPGASERAAERAGTAAARSAVARLRRWLPLLRLTPHLALVIPAFDATGTEAGLELDGGVHGKKAIGQLLRSGKAETFAHSQYPLGHACDNVSRWLGTSEPFITDYAFGCEPYLLYNRRAAPKLWEMFVAYGKDRVSFTYELAARGFVFVVQPEVFVVHHRTPAAGISHYGHQPEAWMVGESCWPDFENRVRLKYNFREGWCTQSRIGHAVNFSIVDGSVSCVSQIESICVLNCRPATVRWQGRTVRVLRRRAADGNVSAADDAISLRLEGTSERPPKASAPFAYPTDQRDADRRICCLKEPHASECDDGERKEALKWSRGESRTLPYGRRARHRKKRQRDHHQMRNSAPAGLASTE
jgi:hypothetical protein